MKNVNPDLLYEKPQMVTDGQALKAALNEAFFLGKPSSALEQSMREMGETGTWDPSCFAGSLFLDELLHTCFGLSGEDLPTEANLVCLRQQLHHPPCEPATIHFRQEICRELAENPLLAGNAKALYAALRWLIHHLNSGMQGSFSSYSDKTSWQINVLRQIREAIDIMAKHFQSPTSGLARLGRAGTEVRQSEKYNRLVALLDYEEDMLRLTVSLRVGADGYLRDFRISRLEENVTNRFHSSPGHRFWAKLKLLLRGYRFSNVELIGNLIEAVYKDLETWLVLLLQIAGQLECYLAALAFRRRARSHGLTVCLPRFEDRSGEGGTEIHNLFNPLLFIQGIAPVPTSLRVPHQSITLITGPNSGGKTRLLQAMGIAQLLGQSGFFAPAAKAVLSMKSGLFVSLIQDSSVDQQEGRLGMELLRIRELFEKCGSNCLILLDELCSGTNPNEGIDILDTVLNLLPELETSAFISTHFLDYARGLAEHESAMTFLRAALSERSEPTYTFVPGVAETSLAQATARRLGVTRADLLGLVKERARA